MYNLFDFKYIFKITDKSTNQQKKVLHKGLPSVTSLIVEWYDIVTICNLGHTRYTFKTTFRKKNWIHCIEFDCKYECLVSSKICLKLNDGGSKCKWSTLRHK